MDKTYLFVDGGHLRKYYEEFANKWFGNDGEIDFNKISEDFGADKCFYFDCVADENKFRNLRKSNWRVELGFLSTGNKRTQKEVDTLITVNMVRFAHIGKMDKAILLSGDGDFRPVIEELVRMDVDVKVVGDKKHISQKLMGEANSVRLLEMDDYYKWTSNTVQNIKPFERIVKYTTGNTPSPIINPLKRKTGKFLTNEVTLLQEDERTYFLIFQGFDYFWLQANNENDLITFFELKYGKIDWK